MVNWWIQLSGTILILIFIFKLKIDNVAYVPFLGFTWNYLQFSIVYVIYKRIKYLFFKIAAESDPYPFSWYFLSWISKYIATSWYTRSQLLRIYEFMTLIYCLNSLVNIFPCSSGIPIYIYSHFDKKKIMNALKNNRK